MNGLDFFCRFTVNVHLAIRTHPAIGVIMTRVRANYKLNVICTSINKNKTYTEKITNSYIGHLSVMVNSFPGPGMP